MFSEVVDKIVTTTGRPDQFRNVIDHANTIIRKVHAKALWDRNFKTVEATNLNPAHDCNYMRWSRPSDFSVLRTIQVGDDYLNYERPGRHLQQASDYYYADGNEFILVYPRIKTATIGYYRKPQRFRYFKPNERPAVFDEVTEKWLYLVPNSNGQYTDRLTTDLEEQNARTLVADWLLHEYPDVVNFGTSNLIYSQLGDEQARASYAIFKDSISDLMRVEQFASTDN